MLNFYLEPRIKIIARFKGSECEIAFLKFHFLLDIIMWKLWIITSRRKWNFKKAISPSEPLKCARILVLGSKWKFNILHKICPNFPCNVHRILCTMHRFLCTVLICPYCLCDPLFWPNVQWFIRLTRGQNLVFPRLFLSLWWKSLNLQYLWLNLFRRNCVCII